jgi:hypothetical protein
MTYRDRFGIIGIGISAVIMNLSLSFTILGPGPRSHLPAEEENHPH